MVYRLTASVQFHGWPAARQTEAGTEAHVWDLYLLTRTDRQSDRVEVSPEQLVEANIAAEVGAFAIVGSTSTGSVSRGKVTVVCGGMRCQEMGQRIGCTTRVVGWYHSHPKITVLPSHIGAPQCLPHCGAAVPG